MVSNRPVIEINPHLFEIIIYKEMDYKKLLVKIICTILNDFNVFYKVEK